MGSPAANRRRGARWEVDLVKGLRSLGLDAERLHLNGSKDEGDIAVRHGGRYYVIEAKNAALKPTEFINQSTVEALHFAKNRDLPPAQVHPVVFVKRRQRGFQQGFAILTIEEYLRIIRKEDG